METLEGEEVPLFGGTPLGDRLQAAIDGDLSDVYYTQCVG